MNVTKMTEKYLDDHPSIRDCIRNKLINYSKLSRKIIAEHNLGSRNFDAVLVACRRYYRKISKTDVLEDKILSIFAKSMVEVKNKIAVAVVGKDIFTEDLIDLEKKAKKLKESFYAIEGTKEITLVFSETFLEDVKSRFKGNLIEIFRQLAIVVIRSPEGLQDETPGFITFITGRVSNRGVNILEFMSCWSESLMVISEKDIANVMSALS